MTHKLQDVKFGIVASTWHSFIVDRLVHGAHEKLADSGLTNDSIIVVRCPGAFEIPVVAANLIRHYGVDVVIALGCVVRGETSHFEYVAGPCAYELARLATDTLVPCINGVLAVDDIEQAKARAGGSFGNKGSECAMAALELVTTLNSLINK